MDKKEDKIFKKSFLFLVILGLAACNPPAATETPTNLPPPTETLIPTATSNLPTAPAEWLVYVNEFLGCSFNYPPEATISEEGVTGYPTDELPAGVSSGDYFATLEATYPASLCVGVGIPGAFLTIAPPDDLGGKYTGPCGITGIGVYDIVKIEATIFINGAYQTVQTTQLYDTSSGLWQHEFTILRGVDGFRVDFGSASGATQAEYLAAKPVILLILASITWTLP